MEHGGVDALNPGGVLVAQVLVQLQHRAHLPDLLGWNPRLGQPASGQQLPQQLGVGLVFSGHEEQRAAQGPQGRRRPSERLREQSHNIVPQ